MKAKIIDILVAIVFSSMIACAVYMSDQRKVDDNVTSIEVGPDEEFIVRFTSDGRHMMIVSTRAETFFLYRLTEPWDIITGKLINEEEDL